tara:strand:- start:1428 stop:1895 length:468 start_codon:yes stop_codon:yes gene_type:complete
MKIDSDISKIISKKIGSYNFEVGILENKNKKIADHKGSANYAGMEVSATKGTSNKLTVADVAKYTDDRFDWLARSFTRPNNSDVKRVVEELANQVFEKGSKSKKRLENAVQAVVRNPILRGDYGKNKSSTIKSKGFDKLGIDTAQLFKSIKAKVL